MTKKSAIYVTVEELVRRGKQDIPDTLVPRKNLIYSSPATLSFNSPGAEGFGVKRAALAVPGSVMLVVSPGCCGRNTSSISSLPDYQDRFYYLTMDETDLVTGRHLKKIPEAVRVICVSRSLLPSVVMVCSTCVDALLGSDMERVCRRAEALVGIPVRPCYMYALTREGSRPPMVQVRQSIYSLLKSRTRRSSSFNLLGYFSPLDEDSELPTLLEKAGVKTVRQLSTCDTYEAFLHMAEANVNLVLDGEAREAAADMEKRLGIPYIELRRLYQEDRIAAQYRALGQVLGVTFQDDSDRLTAQSSVQQVHVRHPQLNFAVGEWTNADPFELTLALLRYGFRVAEIFSAPNRDSYRYLEKIAVLSPKTRVYMNQSPSMMLYKPDDALGINVTIGRDALYYHPDCPNVPWASDSQPWGYGALIGLMRAIDAALEGKNTHTDEGIRLTGALSSKKSRTDPARQDGECPNTMPDGIYQRQSYMDHNIPPHEEGKEGENAETQSRKEALVPGLRIHLTPFAPDQSGAEEVLFPTGAMTIVLDAGGCTGNLCGFDEPRWFSERSRVMSAGMRDIDAVLGRDKALLSPAAEAAKMLEPTFTALLGTPVPSVIAMDYRAMEKMTRKLTDTQTIGIDTNGMELYDTGIAKAYLALLRKFGEERDAQTAQEVDTQSGFKRIDVWGAVPLDIGEEAEAKRLIKLLQDQGWDKVCLHGFAAGIEDYRTVGQTQLNLVISPGGLAAARYLRQRYGTPYEIDDPLADLYSSMHMFSQNAKGQAGYSLESRKVLIVHQQVRSAALTEQAWALGAATVRQASFFLTDPEISSCVHLSQENDFTRLVRDYEPDVIVADPVMRALVPAFKGLFIPAPHFAVSGKLKR